MKIEHIAMWVRDLEEMRRFYETYFEGRAGKKYVNERKGFQSYFISFSTGCRLELMQKPGIPEKPIAPSAEHTGLIHFAISLGSKSSVDQLTETLRSDGFVIIGEPRTTGDGYYESVVLDPEGNRIELTE